MYANLGRSRKRPHKGRRRAILGAIVAVLVVAGLVLAWPHVFSSGEDPGDGGGPMLAGDPVDENTPDPGAAGTSSLAGHGFSPATGDASPRSNDSADNSGQTTAAGEQGGTPSPSPSPPVQDNRDPSAKASALMADALQLDRRGDAVKARTLLSQALAANPNGSQRATIVERLVDLCGRTLLSSNIVPGDPEVEVYEVVSGDALSRIGGRYQIPYPLVKQLNGLSRDLIHIGQKLKVVKGPFRVRILKSKFTLELWLRDTLVKTFPVAIGQGASTPKGAFEVTDKLPDPTFYPPPSLRGRMPVIEGGRPDNPLGTHWIRFGERQLSLGIHGTNEPESIGKMVSLGCVRMRNEDVAALYNFLVVGSKVEILD